jgi:histidyl-tRNA synthetase
VTISSVKGFRDILSDEAARRRRIVGEAVRLLHNYGYEEIELPVLERLELFSRSVGQTSDIVEKEMYAFEDRDGTTVALRPEGTASVARAYIENGLARSQPIARLYYLGPMFRRERPQKGRYRQFSQVGAELLGRDDAEADAETLCLVADLCRAVGVGGARIEINSLGDDACRPAYREARTAFGRAHLDELCAECRARLERNPLRHRDCKNERCRAITGDAPVMLDYLCDACRTHHDRVLELIRAAGVETVPNPRMVRGLDYYCRTAFEILASGLGAQDAIGGGGRYDGLVAALGGPEVPGIGFAFGIDRLDLASSSTVAAAAPTVLVVPIGPAAAASALGIARRLRNAGVTVDLASSERRLKAALKHADKTAVRYVVIVGDDELASGRATVRDMAAHADYPGCFEIGAAANEIVASIERTAAREA